ncbi:DNA-directed RNA polymerase sigma-70 factor [Bacteroidia bacterium]|nr:DNA-directed RNA polymerase sigma-70 factor [Bacteroidia bacterium]
MNAEIFKKIFLPYHAKLYRIAYKFLENQQDSEDIVQETYMKLWQKRNDWESLINPESFAVTLLKNNCLDYLRKVKPETNPVDGMPIQASDSSFVQIENRDQLNHIRFIMKQLPVLQQQVIQLKIWDNHSDEEIEKITGLTKGNIKVLVSRARKKIKELYQKWEKYENR